MPFHLIASALAVGCWTTGPNTCGCTKMHQDDQTLLVRRGIPLDAGARRPPARWTAQILLRGPAELPAAKICPDCCSHQICLLCLHGIGLNSLLVSLRVKWSQLHKKSNAHHAWASAIGTTNPHMVAKALTKGIQIACSKHMTKSNQQIQHKKY